MYTQAKKCVEARVKFLHTLAQHCCEILVLAQPFLLHISHPKSPGGGLLGTGGKFPPKSTGGGRGETCATFVPVSQVGLKLDALEQAVKSSSFLNRWTNWCYSTARMLLLF